MKTQKQREKIIDFLKEKGKVSSLAMMKELNITSPHRRMFEINQMQGKLGFCIKSMKVHEQDGTHFNLYYLSPIPKLNKLPEINLHFKNYKTFLNDLKKRIKKTVIPISIGKTYDRCCSKKRGASVSEHRGA